MTMMSVMMRMMIKNMKKEYVDHLSLVIIEHDKFGARVASFRGVRARHRRKAGEIMFMIMKIMMMLISIRNTTVPMVAW